MYQNRFRNKRTIRLFQWAGRFSLTHLGGWTFLYVIPGLNTPIVGKIEFSRRKYHIPTIALMGFFLFSFIFISFFNSPKKSAGNNGELAAASASTSQPIQNNTEESGDITSLQNKNVNADELQSKSDELKSIIFQEEKLPEMAGDVEVYNYKIKPGDTLSEIANRYNIQVSQIAASSGINLHALLKPGQKITIPSKPGLVYTIKKGETLAHLASKYKVNLEKVERDNPHLEDLDLIEPGTRLFLPEAKIPAPPSPWRKPAYGRITSGFGYRYHPILRRRRLHEGIDIGVYFRPVYAARDGKVIYAGYLGAYGRTVVIKHDDHYKTLYAHLSRIHVNKGDNVKAGRRVATSGNSGMSTGPHLHFELIKDGRPINPRKKVHF